MGGIMNIANLVKLLNRIKKWLKEFGQVDSATINLRAELKLKPGVIHATKNGGKYASYRWH